MISEAKIRLIFFLILFGATTLFLAAIFLPFLSPLILAGSLALIFRPLHRRILAQMNKWPSVAALLTLLLIFSIVILPLTLLAGQVFIEARVFYATLTEVGEGGSPLTLLIADFNDYLGRLAPFLSLDIAQAKTEAIGWLVENLNLLFTGALQTGLKIFVFLIALFYFIRDGEKLKKALIIASPLADKDDGRIFTKLRQATNAVFLGSLFIALIQGLLAAIGLAIFGISQPILLGALSAIMSLIPGIGASLIFIPVILLKLSAGAIPSVIGLAIWATVVVGSVDNILKPYFIKRGVNIHPFMILISVLGGILVFGPIGFILGPTILTLFFTLFDMYTEVISNKAAIK